MIQRKQRPQRLIDMVIALYSETHSAYTTARRVGISPFIAYSILKENGVPIPTWTDPKPAKWKITGEREQSLLADYKNGVTLAVLQAKYDCGEAAIHNTLKRNNVILRDHGGQRRRVTDEEASEIIQMFQEGMPQAAIATAMKCGASVVSRILTGAGLFTKGRATGEKHGSWQGGLSKADGYILEKIYSDNPYFAMATRSGYVKQHRYVMAKHLGRILLRSETVHHINGDRADNRIENLQLRQGRHGAGVKYVCLECGSCNVEVVEI